MKNLALKIIFFTLCLKNLQGEQVTCQDFNPANYVKFKGKAIICFDDDGNGCENDDDGCVLPNNCDSYKNIKTYNTGGEDKTLTAGPVKGSPFKNAVLSDGQKDLCVIDAGANKITDSGRRILDRNILL